MSRLRIALAKGRLYAQSVERFRLAGAAPAGDPGRRLLVPSTDPTIEFLVVKPADVPVYVESAAPAETGYPALPGGITARVATKYPRLAHAHFGARGRPVDIVTVYGSVEVAPLLNLAHWIVDLVDTGNTLRANGLVERETILQCSAVLVANRAAQKLKLDAYLGLMERLERV